MNPIPATDGPQPDQAQFEAWYGGPNAPSHAFEKNTSGFYKYSATKKAWEDWRAGWLACSAQQAPVKAVDLQWERTQDKKHCAKPLYFMVFCVRECVYRDGFSAFLNDGCIDLDQTLSTVLSCDDAKAICQGVFNRLVLELIEGPKSCN